MSASGRLRDRPAALWIGFGVVLLVAALLVGPPPADGAPLDPASTGPLGVQGLVRLLERLGADVTVLDEPPSEGVDVAVVLSDRLGSARRDEVRAWVRGGGTLVVADPGSELLVVPVVADLADPRAGEAGCGIEALRGVAVLHVDGVGFDLGLRDVGCLGDGDSFFVAASPAGGGTIVAVGGAGVWVNDSLADADNAVLAGALLAPGPGTSVGILVQPPVGAGTKTLTDLLDDGVKQALLQLGVAFLLYALWRGRRLGGPVDEAQPVELAASELVLAVGDLLQQGRHRGRAAATISDDVRRRLAERLGLPATAPAEAVVDVAADRTGLDRDRLAGVLCPVPLRGDGELAVLASDAHTLSEELARAR
ncbi:MAG: DUF4350 domain-containing protein [Acidimicrobiales bacterium]